MSRINIEQKEEVYQRMARRYDNQDDDYDEWLDRRIAQLKIEKTLWQMIRDIKGERADMTTEELRGVLDQYLEAREKTLGDVPKNVAQALVQLRDRETFVIKKEMIKARSKADLDENELELMTLTDIVLGKGVRTPAPSRGGEDQSRERGPPGADGEAAREG